VSLKLTEVRPDFKKEKSELTTVSFELEDMS